MSCRITIEGFDNAENYPVAHLPQAAVMLLFCTEAESMESITQALTIESSGETEDSGPNGGIHEKRIVMGPPPGPAHHDQKSTDEESWKR